MRPSRLYETRRHRIVAVAVVATLLEAVVAVASLLEAEARLFCVHDPVTEFVVSLRRNEQKQHVQGDISAKGRVKQKS